MKNLFFPLTLLFFLFSACESVESKNNDDNCPEVDAGEIFTQTIYLNLLCEEASSSKWQLCHAELEDSVKPFVILTKIKGERKESNYHVEEMKFKAQPFLGERNFYKILNVTKSDSSNRHDGYNMYDINIEVGLNNEEVKSDSLSDFDVDSLTAFDYHVNLSKNLGDFIACNINLEFNKETLFFDRETSNPVEEIEICCGAICASRFIY
ncbi:hypothetical protein [uncultured Croceitalea sp.]|uniref:hypothetical protein n=1 Tax=uncultured Croceitalea sp. TaxID=1798908 RepID=UPI003305EC01